MKLGIWILWPSFVVGAAANAIFFTLFDPAELHAHWDVLPVSRIGAYTLGLFAFWAIAACSSAFTCFLQRTETIEAQVWCPVPNERRPLGCRLRGSR